MTAVSFCVRLNPRLGYQLSKGNHILEHVKMNFHNIVIVINSFFTKIKPETNQNRLSDILSFLMKKPQKDKMGT